ncbi:MAG: T9SS type A sorting domain-containing protein [Bacteroidota bacterium]|nr:T9SS type A sorting domain-containing protein [Bacteroidota bacterium]
MKRLFTICALFLFLCMPLINAQIIDQTLYVTTTVRTIGADYVVDYMLDGVSLPTDIHYLDSAVFNIKYDNTKLTYKSAAWSGTYAPAGSYSRDANNNTPTGVIACSISKRPGNRTLTSIPSPTPQTFLTLTFTIKVTTGINLSITGSNTITLSRSDASNTSSYPGTGRSLTQIFVDNSALPVELTSFAGRCVQNKIHLNWNTATEVSNLGFDIERSSDKINWQKIAFINGNGNSNSPKNYSYVDNSAMESKCYYRLKQIDTDGQCHYSNTIEINTSQNSGSFTLEQNYPNPFNPVTNISFFLPSESFVSIKVFDVLGREVTTLIHKQLTAGYQNVYFDASNLASGTYLYRMEAGAFTQVRKLIVTK